MTGGKFAGLSLGAPHWFDLDLYTKNAFDAAVVTAVMVQIFECQ